MAAAGVQRCQHPRLRTRLRTDVIARCLDLRQAQAPSKGTPGRKARRSAIHWAHPDQDTERVSKYSIAKTTIADAMRQTAEERLDGGDVIEALIVMAIQESIKRRGAAETRASLTYELSNVAGTVDYDFVRSR